MRNAMMMLSLTLVVGACGKKDKPADHTGSGSGSAVVQGSGSDMAGSGSAMAGSGSDMAGSGSAMAGSGSDMAGSGSAADTEMTKKAGNCPSTVFGSTTKAEIKGKDVVLTIASDDKDAIGAIQRRTSELIKEKTAGATGGAGHDQKGTHGGGIGLCPVFFGDGGTAKSTKIAKGVTITITPKGKPEELKPLIDERIAKVAEWLKANVKPADAGNMGGVGGGSGDHGSTHKGSGDSHGKERGKDGSGSGAGTGGGGGKGTGGGSGKGDKKGK